MTRSFFLSSAFLALQAAAQQASPYTDAKSGIKFSGVTNSGFTVGIALPENPTTDFIGQLVVPITNDGGYGALTMASSMVDSLMVVAWPHENKVISSFRKATGYTNPAVATGDFKLTTIPDGTYVNDTAFAYTFLCSNCIGEGALTISETATNVLGYAFSDDALKTPASASGALNYHSAGFGAFGLPIDGAKSADYDKWAALATGDASNGTGNGNSTAPISSTPGSGANLTATIANATYDYIICGAGPAGIISASRLAESGASVLLVERGGPSYAETGNKDTLSWNSTRTMYEVPGFAYYLSQVGKPAYCTDTANMAGCVLGGGTMVNALMFVKPQARDFDDKWPTGWKWNDVAKAADRLYERNPGQNYGSNDDVRYNNEAYGVLSKFFQGQGWKQTDFIKGDHNARKDVYGYPPWDLANGLRAGPVRSYLPIAKQQKNFKLMLNTNVIRAVRNGSTISGVELETEAGARVIYNVKAGGSVILASGAMSTPRLLFNSGIGPAKQLQTVASGTSGVKLPAESEWIDLPVGAEIKDHTIFTIKFNTNSTLPALPTTDFTAPNQTTIDLFAKGDGLLAQSGQRLSFWTSVNTTSGKEVFIQGTCNGPANNTVQMKIYLTHGLTSVGSLGITADGATELTSEPWMQTDEDKEAITAFMDRLLKMTRAPGSGLSIQSSASGNVTGADLIKDHVTGSHWVGTAKMGKKGDAGVVVDTDTKVYGTDNLFVVDASIHPDLPTGNTQAIVMVAAEKAVERIMALKGGKVPSASTPGGAANTQPIKSSTVSSAVAAASSSVVPTLSASSAPAQATGPTQSTPAAQPSQSSQPSKASPTASPSRPTQAPPANGNNPQPNPYWNSQPGNTWWNPKNKRQLVHRRPHRRAYAKGPVWPNSAEN
ncbi:cellobiose dehydrogenase [Periconia macrospinosa]|uniref:Cellobiose dehydrogenase n=1 Tax=Periconia macrospinosa TaxID=97972 RepID=A0A2V1DC04_9PLEO|nr:cellobiose dehydrogenase [Periconia macrospinosa]